MHFNSLILKYTLIRRARERTRLKKRSKIWSGRRKYSEWFHLVPLLRNEPQRFWEYFRMSEETFDYLVEMLDPELSPKLKGYGMSIISSGEKLAMTIR